MKRTVSLFMSIVMILTSFLCCPISVFADITAIDTITHSNPLYDDVDVEYDNFDDTSDIDSLIINKYAKTKKAVIHQQVNSASIELKNAMVNREPEIDICIISKSSDVKALAEEIFNGSFAEENADGSQDGDYLKWNWRAYTVSIYRSNQSDGYLYTFTFEIQYYTTFDEEQIITQRVNDAIDALNLNSKSEYMQIKLVHDFICDTVKYDYDHVSDSTYQKQYTAYAAIVDGKAVCQGYATLFYRMCKMVGLPVRIITGSNHSWNIVKIGDAFYNIDCTWDDSSNDNQSAPDGDYWSSGYVEYTYFLKGYEDFLDHIREDEYNTEEFNAKYPMAEAAYLCACSNIKWVYPEEARCDTGFEKKKICTNCEKVFDAVVVPPNTAHDYSVQVIPNTCTEQGYTNYYCKICSYTYTGDYINAAGHSFTSYTGNNDATCTLDGTKTAKCDRCDVTETITDVGSRLGHSYDVLTVESPTCTEQGYTIYQCSRCNILYNGSYINAIGHSFLSYECDNNATCLTDGTKTARCERCDEANTIIDTGSRLSHNYTATVIPPTCTSQGYTVYACSVCGNSVISDYKVAAGHTFNGGGSCVICGAVNQNYVEPTTAPKSQSESAESAKATTKATTKDSTVKKPKSTSISKLIKSKMQFKVTWKKVSSISGYQIQYSTDKKFKKNVKTVTVKKSSTSSTIKKLKSKKTYYVRVCTYKSVKVNGKTKKVCSSWSKVKSVKTK